MCIFHYLIYFHIFLIKGKILLKMSIEKDKYFTFRFSPRFSLISKYALWYFLDFVDYFFFTCWDLTSNKSTVFHVDSELGHIKCTIFISFQNLQYWASKAVNAKHAAVTFTLFFFFSFSLVLILFWFPGNTGQVWESKSGFFTLKETGCSVLSEKSKVKKIY